MTLKELATALGIDEAKASELLASKNIELASLTASMLPSLGAGLHGGQLAATQTGITAPAKPKAQTQAGKLAKKPIGETENTALTTAEPQTEPAGIAQFIKQIEQPDATNVFTSVEQVNAAEVNALAVAINPHLRMVQNLRDAHAVSQQMSANYDAQGFTLDALVAAAIPKYNPSKRPTMEQRLEAALANMPTTLEGVS
jgi:hypothetical protein